MVDEVVDEAVTGVDSVVVTEVDSVVVTVVDSAVDEVVIVVDEVKWTLHFTPLFLF